MRWDCRSFFIIGLVTAKVDGINDTNKRSRFKGTTLKYGEVFRKNYWRSVNQVNVEKNQLSQTMDIMSTDIPENIIIYAKNLSKRRKNRIKSIPTYQQNDKIASSKQRPKQAPKKI